MKPYQIILPVAIVCAMGTGYTAFVDNNIKQADANRTLGAEALTAEAKASADEQRKTLLLTIATEALNNKPATVVFDQNEQLTRVSEMPKVIAKEQAFTIGYDLPESLKVSSVGLYNLRSGEYAAIGTLKGKRVIIAVYTLKEVEKAVTQVRG